MPIARGAGGDVSTRTARATAARGAREWVLLGALAAALVAGFVRLGLWQLDRATYKDALNATCAARARAPRLALDALPPEPDALPGACRRVAGRVEVSGRDWLLLDNQVRGGRAGYLVYAPARLPDGRWMLLERGFVAVADRSRLPALERDAGPLTVSGFLAAPPAAGIRLGDEPGVERLPGGWWRVQRIDPATLRATTGRTYLPVVLRDGPPRVATPMSADRHRAYAGQWFALAATVVAVYAALLARRLRRHGR